MNHGERARLSAASIRQRRGMTLVELLIVLAVIGLGAIGAARALRQSSAGVAASVADHVRTLTPLEPGSAPTATAPEPTQREPAPPAHHDEVPSPFAGLQPCLVQSYEASHRESYTLGWNYGESSTAYQHQKLSNGTEIYYEGASKGSGRDVGAGITIPIEGVPLSLAGGITVSGATENGYLWILDSQAQRDAENKLRTKIAVDAYMHGPHLPDLNDPNWAENEVLRAQYFDIIKHQNVDRIVTRVSATGQVSLGADALGLSADQALGVGVAKTVEQDKDGTRVVTYELNGAASQELGSLTYGEYAAGQEGKFTAAVTVDAQGTVTGVDITGIQGLKAGHNEGFDLMRVDSFAKAGSQSYSKAATEVLGKLGDYLNTTFEYTNRDDATSALRTSIHIDPRSSGVDGTALSQVLREPTVQSTRALLDSVSLSGSSLDVQLYSGKDHVEDTSVKAQLGVGLGGSSTSVEKELGLTDAWTLSKDGLAHRTDCVP
jgi:prepilin-type N-terminal cleavage/methylation domain-containing protein